MLGGTVIRSERIYIIRHAEKPKEAGNKNLYSEGKHHTELLATSLPKQLGDIDFFFDASNSSSMTISSLQRSQK